MYKVWFVGVFVYIEYFFGFLYQMIAAVNNLHPGFKFTNLYISQFSLLAELLIGNLKD